MLETLVNELMVSFPCSDIHHLDIQALRAAFADLMDAAASAAHAAGLEQDDCILERLADVRLASDGTVKTIEVDMLGDRERCIRGILDQCRPPEKGSGAFAHKVSGIRSAETCEGVHGSQLGFLTPFPVAIVALRLRVIRGRSLDPFGLSPS